MHATPSGFASSGEKRPGGELLHHRAEHGLPEEPILERQEVGDPRLGVGFPDLTADRDEGQAGGDDAQRNAGEQCRRRPESRLGLQATQVIPSQILEPVGQNPGDDRDEEQGDL
jgi:hypothetical protein